MFTTFTCQSTSLTRPLRSKYTVHEENNKSMIFIIFPKKKEKGKKENQTSPSKVPITDFCFNGF